MDRTPSDTPTPRCPPPPRHKLALLTFLGLLAPVYLIPPALADWLPEQPFIVVVLAVAIIVVLMTYGIMPALKWVFAPWLRA